MKITAKASGGLAGRSEHYQLDTTCKPDGQSVEQLVEHLGFFGAAPTCNVGADIPRWEITVEDGARSHTVTVSEDGSPTFERWQALIEHLRRS